MELKEFIKETIIGINQAIQELNIELKDDDIIINPKEMRFEGNINRMIYNAEGKQERLVHEIEFSLCISNMEQTDKGGGVKISVMNAGISNKAGIENLNTVKFSIPVAYLSKG